MALPDQARPTDASVEVTVQVGAPDALTLSSAACAALGLRPGDRVLLSAVGGTVILDQNIPPDSLEAVKALRELQAAVAASGVTEEMMLAEARRFREEAARRYDESG